MSTDDVDLPSLANVLAERLAEARARLSEVEAERDAAKIELEAWRPVVEAARAWAAAVKDGTGVSWPRQQILDAVDALPTRNLDSTPTDPSLTAETLTPGGGDG